jgi:hypothetical protein
MIATPYSGKKGISQSLPTVFRISADDEFDPSHHPLIARRPSSFVSADGGNSSSGTFGRLIPNRNSHSSG